MADELVYSFDDAILRLPSCLAVHRQVRSQLQQYTSENYVALIGKFCETKQSRICGILRNSSGEREVLALAFYRRHFTTFDTVRFEIHDFVVADEERHHGLGARLLAHLFDQAKQAGAPSVVLQCDLTNTNAHRFFFRHGFTVSSFGFYFDHCEILPGNDEVRAIDITDLPEKENEEMLLQAQSVFRQLRPNLPADPRAYIDQIRSICQAGPARMVVAVRRDDSKDVLGLAIYRRSKNIKYGEHLYCDDLITDENKRSTGVGRCLINAMKKAAQGLGSSRLALDSGCQRGRAHKFYHREGFHIDQFEFTFFF